MVVERTPILANAETRPILELLNRAPGIYLQEMQINGNSLLSSVYLRTADPGVTVDVEYFETTSGTTLLGEEVELNRHDQLTAANVGQTNKILVTRVHNKPFVRVTVAGGSAEFGVYVSVRSESASDIDQALHRDQDDADLLVDKGIPIVTLDEDEQKFYILRADKGILQVSNSEAGDSVHLATAVTTTPTIEQTIISSVVPIAKIRKVTRIAVTSRAPVKYTCLAAGVTIATGRTGSGQPDSSFTFAPRYALSAGETLELRILALTGPASDLEAYVMASDEDV